MAFLVGDRTIHFEDYKALNELIDNHRHLTDLVSFMEEWYSREPHINVQTSGSTGKPKTIQLSKQDMLASARNTADYFDFEAGKIAILSVPVRFIAGKMMVVRSILSDLDLHCVPISAAPLSEIDGICHFAPLTPHQFLSSKLEDIDKVESILLGGGPINEQVLSKVAITKAAVYHGFGMTETITHIALRRLGDGADSNLFHALPGIDLTTDNNGCLKIRSNYLDEIITNDVVELVTAKSFRWLGRRDNIINSGGIKLAPENIESKISKHLVFPHIIASETHELLGEQLILLIETSNEIDTQALLKLIATSLNPYEVPKKVYLLPEFVRTRNGKIQRQKTMDNLGSTFK